ncbi:MAG: cupin domain-containing protein [Terriglobia bacterium]
MNYSRRDLCLLWPGMIAARAFASGEAVLPSKVYPFQDLPVRGHGENRSRPVFSGATHTGFHVDLHETNLAPGAQPHPPHHHVHEEVFMIREGTVEVTLRGRSSRLGPGSVAYIASNTEHGIRNVGKTHAHYFVMAIGRDPS